MTFDLNCPRKTLLNRFKCCGLNLANDGTEDDFNPLFKKGTALQSWKTKAQLSILNSQLLIAVDKSDAVNPSIFLSDEEEANEEINMNKDQTNEEIIM